MNCYREQRNLEDNNLLKDIRHIIDHEKICVIGGDFSINMINEYDHSIVKAFEQLNFKQLINYIFEFKIHSTNFKMIQYNLERL